MPRICGNGVELDYDLTGAGETLVLVHGSWSDRTNWLPVMPQLARAFRVVAYDRRGNGLSTHAAPGSRRDHEDDLAALVEEVCGEPAHVVGTSFGASIALGLAARRPELVRSVVGHEPPLISVTSADPEVRIKLEAVQTSVETVIAQVESGDAPGAAERFVEEVALGPGSWRMLPEPLRATMIDSAAAFVTEQQDPAWADIELEVLAASPPPLLLTRGDESPPWFAPIVSALAGAIGDADVHTYRGAGHAPHLTHPRDYVTTVVGFLLGVDSRRGLEPIAVAD